MRQKKYKSISVVLLFVAYLTFSTSISSQTLENKIYFENLSIHNGLSLNTVTCIIQDDLGFMWFGTKDGLNRYDGVSFDVYGRSETSGNSLNNNFIRQLYQDKSGIIWIGTDAGIYQYLPKEEKFSLFDTLSDNSRTKVKKSISDIYEDKLGQIWIAAESQGLFCYNKKNETFIHYPLDDHVNLLANVECLFTDANDRMWIGTFGTGLYYSEDGLQTIQPYKTDAGEILFEDDVVTNIKMGNYNCLYVSSNKQGLIEINLSTNKSKKLIYKDEKGDNIYIRDFIFNDNHIWIGSESGLYIYDLTSQQFINYRSSIFDPYSISDNAIYAISKDREGGIWIGSYFGGVNYYPPQLTPFEKYYPTGEKNSIKSRRVREFCGASDGSIWIGTEDGGLNKFDPQSKKFEFVELTNNFKNIHALYEDDNELWIGTFMSGLKVLNTTTGKVRSYSKTDKDNSINDNNIFAIHKTKSGYLYLGTLLGLNLYNAKKDNFTVIPELVNKFVYDIYEDTFGDIWVATYVDGVFRYKIKEKRWINYQHNDSDPNSLPYDKVISIYEDSKKRLWITTQGRGICLFDRENENFKNLAYSLGLANEVVYQMIEDDNGIMWMSTNRGLIRYDISNDKIRRLTTANGLLTNQFNYQSSFKDKNGILYFGSVEGFIAFNPNSLIFDTGLPKVTISDFSLFNKKVIVGAEKSPLSESILFSDKVNLKASQNSFSLKLALLNFGSSEINNIVYMLEGFDVEWQKLRGSQVVSYSNLSHGSYTFKAKVLKNNESEGDALTKMLYINIAPPIYLTLWAYIFYFVLVLSVVYLSFRYIRKRNQAKQRLAMEKFEQMKELEVYNSKIEFFTNVAHDIRTPLTLIKGPLENIMLKEGLEQDVVNDLHIMNQNTNRLLSLINQLLDFRKTEVQGFKLNFTKTNLSELLDEICQRFSLIIRNRKINFHLDLLDEDFYADVDKEAVTKIVSNLLSNAIKYTSRYIEVGLTLSKKGDKSTVIIRIENDGDLIPLEYRKEIFKPFVGYSKNGVSSGTGIGLALSRSLAELHQGTLTLDEAYDRTVFCLELPIFQSSAITLPNDLRTTEPLEEPLTAVLPILDAEDVSRDIILIVEDNKDMLMFLKKQLEQRYIIFCAENGEIAMELLDSHYINLVISDVVMPEMDGFQLCEKLKSDVNYSHIPIILLTAKTNLQSKIQGLELGADAYIEKPFSTVHLMAMIDNLLANRKKLRQAYTSLPFTLSNSIVQTDVDSKFIQELHTIIQANFHNPEFQIDDIADSLNMSRSSFYRKIKGTIDLSPNDYLRLERLKKAAQLLKEGKYQVNEICYMVGFSSPSYFSKCFQKQFGTLPKDF